MRPMAHGCLPRPMKKQQAGARRISSTRISCVVCAAHGRKGRLGRLRALQAAEHAALPRGKWASHPRLSRPANGSTVQVLARACHHLANPRGSRSETVRHSLWKVHASRVFSGFLPIRSAWSCSKTCCLLPVTQVFFFMRPIHVAAKHLPAVSSHLSAPPHVPHLHTCLLIAHSQVNSAALESHTSVRSPPGLLTSLPVIYSQSIERTHT